MGWSGTYKPKGQTLKQYFSRSFSYPDHPDAGLLDLASQGFNLAYAAVRHPKGYVFGTVIQTQYTRDEYENFQYRIDDESSGPVHATCPERILNLLTPDQEAIKRFGWKEGGYWQEWRERCRANLKAKKNQPKVKDGSIIRFESPITFTDGSVYDTFVLKRERTFRGGTVTRFIGAEPKENGVFTPSRFSPIYRIRHWRKRPYEVLQY